MGQPWRYGHMVASPFGRGRKFHGRIYPKYSTQYNYFHRPSKICPKVKIIEMYATEVRDRAEGGEILNFANLSLFSKYHPPRPYWRR